ncbi:MAG TPA: GGDEF domain-containing protein [Magnetospirillaceae bacterium]|nr:GGDEF domain-containing protein [Magnetospirillaceae bacterium]
MRARIDQLNRRAWNDMQTDFQEALALAREALAESERISYSEGGAFACLNIGWIMCYLGRSDESRVAFEKAQKYYAALDDPLGRSKALNGLGVMNYHVSRYERALDYYTQSLDVARRHGLRDREAATLNNIGEVCADLGNYKEGLDYFLKAYDTAPEAHSPELRAVILLNIGKSFVLQENFVLAEEFVRKALDLAESEKLSILVASCWDMLGRISRGTGDDPEAELRFRKAVALAEKFQSCREIIEAQLDLGSLLLGRGGIDEAWEILDRAARTADEVHANSLYFAALERLAEAHERKGDFRTALDYFRRYARYEREVQNEDTTRKIKDVQVQYEMERTLREAEIYRLRNIELKEKSDGLEEVNKQVLTISEIGRRITSSLDMATVISTLYESLCTLMVTDLFALAFYDSSTESLRYAAYIEDGQNIARGSVPLDPGKSFSAWCVRNASRVFIRDLESEYRDYLEGEPKNLQGRQGRSFIYLPLSIENTVIGVMMVQSWKKESYTDHHLRFLTALAPYVAIAMENAMIHVRMEELNHELKREKEQLERATQQISYLANHDSLTGLPNRRLLFELLRKSLEIAHRAGTKVGILYVDLDDFKPINDRFGHVAGDRTLAEIAARLQSALRASDTIARVGGDEFIAVLNQVRGRPDVEAAARKVLEACDAPIETLGEPCRIGASMGIAIFPDDGDTLEGILHCADSAMYTIKHTTKRGYAFYGAKS